MKEVRAVKRGTVHLCNIVGVEVERESVDEPGKSLRSWRAPLIRVGRWFLPGRPTSGFLDAGSSCAWLREAAITPLSENCVSLESMVRRLSQVSPLLPRAMATYADRTRVCVVPVGHLTIELVGLHKSEGDVGCQSVVGQHSRKPVRSVIRQ